MIKSSLIKNSVEGLVLQVKAIVLKVSSNAFNWPPVLIPRKKSLGPTCYLTALQNVEAIENSTKNVSICFFSAKQLW